MSKGKYALKYTIEFDQDGFTKESCNEYQNVTDVMILVDVKRNDKGSFSHEVHVYNPVKDEDYSKHLFAAFRSIAIQCSLSDSLTEWKKEFCQEIESQIKQIEEGFKSCK